ncbi:MAG: DUF2071 domain-containing protein [Acidobacteriota bacterium]
MPASRFLTARWEHLVLFNYIVDPACLRPLVPAGTELDDWHGRYYVSLVGFQFRNTRVLGVPLPGHRHFEEVNLRFYVRRDAADGRRRAVVFIRELVPRRAIAAVAYAIYNEPYLAVPMSHQVDVNPTTGGAVRYGWRFRGTDYAMDAVVEGRPAYLDPSSEGAFITEHYWGYTRQRDGGTLEYEVEHPPWLVWTPTAATFTGRALELYGATFGPVLMNPPASAFVALGSPVVVRRGRRLASP